MSDLPKVAAVVVTLNGLPWLPRCLDSLGDTPTVVVDHGSTDGTIELVRNSYPRVQLVEQGNLGMGAGNNAGMRALPADYWFLVNSDAWVEDGALDELLAFADAHPRAAVVGPRLQNTDGTLQKSVRADPTLWGLATEYFFLRKLAPNTRVMNPMYVGGFAHDVATQVDWVSGAALLVRRDAATEVGLFDEAFFMFSEESDWQRRFRDAGWEVWFDAAAIVVHVGGASHGGRLYVENLRGHVRWFAKHRGVKAARRARLLLLTALRLRTLVYHGDRGASYREGVRFLSSGDVEKLLA
jgi:hypothetical protein